MASDTLIIKHFPTEFLRKDKEEFLKACGAIYVKVLDSKLKKYNATFARFADSNVAEKVLQNLHQKEMSGRLLSAEFATGKVREDVDIFLGRIGKGDLEGTTSEKMLKRFLDKLNSWTDGAQFSQPVPTNLNYAFPPPDPSTLRNIVRLLASSPRLYTQVLHLINKMNLPCPIGKDQVELGSIPSNLFQTDARENLPPSTIPLPVQTNISSTSESELSADEDVPKKEIIPQLKPKPIKRIKGSLCKPTLSGTISKAKKVPFEEVFEKISSLDEKPLAKKLKLRDTSELADEVKNRGKVDDDEKESGFGLLYPVSQSETEEAPQFKRDEREEERGPVEEKPAVITTEALRANRIPEKDRAILPVFKNYAEGAPTCRLYIKNLAKQTTEEELSFIYSRFRVPTPEGTPDMFDIKLMQQGRMKGQAFVTFENIEQAKQGLLETNGYILNDKPMVVQYARSAVK